MKSGKLKIYFTLSLCAFAAAVALSSRNAEAAETGTRFFTQPPLPDESIAAGRDSVGSPVMEAKDTANPEIFIQKDSSSAAGSAFLSDSLPAADSAITADSLAAASDSLAVLDSIAIAAADSIARADSIMKAHADSLAKLTPKELRKYKRDSAKTARNAFRDSLMIKRWARQDSIKYVKDSIRYIKDSIRASKPRILESPAVPDSLKYKRIIKWTNNDYFNEMTFQEIDTTANYYYSEYPFQRDDVDAVYLGVIGSATLSANYFKRQEMRDFEFFSPYLMYSYTPQTMPFYNTKTPHTELAYWGTLFANTEKEESDVKFMSTQNITPALNFNVLYQRFGSNGMLKREDTDNRTLAITLNYLGKRYTAQAGYIYQSVKRSENGGVADPWFITDTVMDVRTLAVNLSDASSTLKRHTGFIHHSYGLPIRWKKTDTSEAGEGTITYFGHSAEFSTYKRIYTDVINPGNDVEYGFYDNYFIHPTTSYDSVRVMSLENKLFIKVQPWASDAIISRINAGVGHQYIENFAFRPEFFMEKLRSSSYNNLYAYAGAEGQLKKYFAWDAFMQYYFAGYRANDFNLDVNARFSMFPIPQGIHLKANFHLESRRPSWHENYYYSNHYRWSNDFNKETTTSVQAELDIPRYKLKAFFGYSLIDQKTYYDTLGIIRQSNVPVSVMSAYLQKNFTVWKLHLDNKILFQLSSDRNVVSLPLLSLNLRYYFEFNLVKNVLTAQIGANMIFNTKYYIPAYNPALGVFQSQNEREIGNFPYMDFFLNLQWKRATIFVKYVNASQQWFNREYFSAYNYIRSQHAFKVGIHWPFYIK